MSEANKAIVRRWFEEVWNQGREETIDELFAPHAVGYGLGDTDVTTRGPAEFKIEAMEIHPFHQMSAGFRLEAGERGMAQRRVRLPIGGGNRVQQPLVQSEEFGFYVWRRHLLGRFKPLAVSRYAETASGVMARSTLNTGNVRAYTALRRERQGTRTARA